MARYLSINKVKYNCKKSMNGLVDENTRTPETAQHYDNGKRMIDINKTRENVVLITPPVDVDTWRKKRIDNVNNQVDALREKGIVDIKLPEKVPRYVRMKNPDGSYVLNEKGNVKRKRVYSDTQHLAKIRPDVNDALGLVVQPSSGFINALPKDKQVAFFKDCLNAIQSDKKTYGDVFSAVVHFDENTPHMQVLTSTIDKQQLRCRANEMFGNKTKMSKDQTRFVDSVKSKGWNVERGLKRIDNPDYKNWADEKKAQGAHVTRFTDHQLLAADHQKQAKEKELNTQVVGALARIAPEYYDSSDPDEHTFSSPAGQKHLLNNSVWDNLNGLSSILNETVKDIDKRHKKAKKHEQTAQKTLETAQKDAGDLMEAAHRKAAEIVRETRQQVDAMRRHEKELHERDKKLMKQEDTFYKQVGDLLKGLGAPKATGDYVSIFHKFDDANGKTRPIAEVVDFFMRRASRSQLQKIVNPRPKAKQDDGPEF